MDSIDYFLTVKNRLGFDTRGQKIPEKLRNGMLAVQSHQPDHSLFHACEYICSEANCAKVPSYFLSLLIKSHALHPVEVDAGAGKYRRPNDPGSLMFGDALNVHRFQGIGPFHAITLSVDRHRLDERITERLPVRKRSYSFESLVSKSFRDPALEILIRRLMTTHGSQDKHSFDISNIEDDIVSRIITLAGAEQEQLSTDDKIHPTSISRVLEFIHANCNRNITRDELAAVSGVTPRHFSRLFHQTVGQTPKKYLTKVRMDHFISVLVNSPKEIPITTLVRECGYDNLSILYHEFKRQIGISPEAYRTYAQK